MLQPTGPRNRRISLMANMKFGPIVEEIKENVVPREQYSLNPDAPSFQMNADGTYSVIPPMNQRRMSNKPVFYSTEGPQYVGMPTRRVSNFSNNNMTGFESAAAGLKLPPNVLRMPKGPDTGKGFSNWCRQRMGEPKRISKAIPIVAPPQNVTLSESLENSDASDASTSSSPLQIPDIHVEAASGSEGYEEDSCSEPEVQEFEIDTNERTR